MTVKGFGNGTDHLRAGKGGDLDNYEVRVVFCRVGLLLSALGMTPLPLIAYEVL